MQAHPLNGLWKGNFAEHFRGRAGVQVVTVLYDFSQRHAVLKAFKVPHDALLTCSLIPS